MTVDRLLLILGLAIAFALIYLMRTGVSCPVEAEQEGIEQVDYPALQL